MGLIYLIIDLVRYPFLSAQQKKTNRFHKLLIFVFKDYPAFFRRKPTFWRALSFPVLLVYHIFKT